jgi:prepilin-type N-terminal cleavage/methylation domain-containing protein
VRRGFSLVEIMVAMALTLAVFAITLPFVRAQTRALGVSAGRLDADQLARYAQRAVDQDLRLASAIPGQPLLVLAGPMAVSFNANLFAVDTSDPGARDINASAATTLTDSWRLADAAALPNTTRNYPPQDYLDGNGVISRIETISYFLHPDTVTGRSDIYVLYRRVNARDSVEVVRSLHVPADSAFFSYYRPVGTTLTRIAAARLPLYWDSVAVDSVTSVGIRAAGYFKDKYTGNISIRTVNWTTVIPNARGRLARSCGAAPGAPGNFVLTKVTGSSPYRVRVTWNASADDNGGALDVQHYALEWRVQGASTWQPLASVPATRAATYEWIHANPRVVGTYEYAIRATDCAGLSSTQVVGSAIVLP